MKRGVAECAPMHVYVYVCVWRGGGCTCMHSYVYAFIMNSHAKRAYSCTNKPKHTCHRHNGTAQPEASLVCLVPPPTIDPTEIAVVCSDMHPEKHTASKKKIQVAIPMIRGMSCVGIHVSH